MCAITETFTVALQDARLAVRQPHGVAFLRATRMLYGLSSVTYLCVNVPPAGGRRDFLHLALSDASTAQWASATRADAAERCIADPAIGLPRAGATLISLRSQAGETALWSMAVKDGKVANPTIRDQVEILVRCFHQHVLQLFGHGSPAEASLSTREIECLRCAAEGRSAEETSATLGITERTVRFHLNAAREKLNCRTTTQAVARAVGARLIVA